jgi:anaerobic magnesium-protoporphyrin IX monomethyl ester cyclase
MSIGHPGETRQTIQETREWLLETKPDDFDVTIITTYPGTPYYDQAMRHPDQPNVWVYTYQKTGDKLYSYEVDYMRVADYYKGDPEGGYKSYVYTDALTAEELVQWRNRLEGDVRKILKIPFNPGRPGERFEHSMGQFGLPSTILRSSSHDISNRKAS